MSKRLVVFGKAGQLGRTLINSLNDLVEVISFGKSEVDFMNTSDLRKVIEQYSPDLVINAIAYTAVDKAEEDKETVYAINAKAVEVLANLCSEKKIGLIHYSTDYVFNGEKRSAYIETDHPDPINEYGMSKVLGEKAIQNANGGYLIFRTSWVYSMWKDSFVTKVLHWARNYPNLKIVDDQFGSPTWATMLAEITCKVVRQSIQDPYAYFLKKRGIYHLAGKGTVSRYEWAKKILEIDPAKEEQIVRTIQPAKSSEFPLPANRPLYTPLDCSFFEETFGINIPRWENSLKYAMKELQPNQKDSNITAP